jgi:hypothetical protein
MVRVMVCIARMKGVPMGHTLLLGAWRRIAHRARVATAVEPNGAAFGQAQGERPWSTAT